MSATGATPVYVDNCCSCGTSTPCGDQYGASATAGVSGIPPFSVTGSWDFPTMASADYEALQAFFLVFGNVAFVFGSQDHRAASAYLTFRFEYHGQGSYLGSPETSYVYIENYDGESGQLISYSENGTDGYVT